MWIFTQHGNLVNAATVQGITRYYDPDKDTDREYQIVADTPSTSLGDVVVLASDLPGITAHEIIEKLAWCIVHDVDLVRINADSDVLELISYSNHGTAKHTQRVYLKQ